MSVLREHTSELPELGESDHESCKESSNSSQCQPDLLRDGLLDQIGVRRDACSHLTSTKFVEEPNVLP